MKLVNTSDKLWLYKYDIAYFLTHNKRIAESAIYSVIGSDMEVADRLFEFLHFMKTCDYDLFEDGLNLVADITYEFDNLDKDCLDEAENLNFLDHCDPASEIVARASVHIIHFNKYADSEFCMPALQYLASFSYQEACNIRDKKTGLVLPEMF